MAMPRNSFVSIIQAALKAIMVLVGALILLELCARGVLYIALTDYFNKKIPPPYGKVMMEAGKFDFWGLTTVNRYDPVCYFLPRGGLFRGPNGRTDYSLKKEANTIRILCIGDSTVYGLAVDYAHSWPNLLRKMLSDQYPLKKIEVLNAGIPGAAPKQTKRIFQFHHAKYRPDIVIWRGNTSLTDTYSVDTTPDFMGSFIGRFLYESRIFRIICVLADHKRPGAKFYGKSASDTYDNLMNRIRPLAKPSDGLNSDFSMVQKIAQEHGTKYVLQAEYILRGDDGSLFSVPENTAMAGGRHVVDRPAVKMMNAFKENDTKTPPDTLFVDGVHLTEKGEALTAAEIYKYIVQNKWIETLSPGIS
jgi:hypothetical protein